MDSGQPKWYVQTRRDFRRLQVYHSTRLLAGTVGLEAAPEISVFRAENRDFVGFLARVRFGAEEIGAETGEIVFPFETQYMMIHKARTSVGWGSFFQSDIACVYLCDNSPFLMSEAYSAFVHSSKVGNPPLRFCDIKHLKLKKTAG